VAEAGEQAVELVERGEADRDLARLARLVRFFTRTSTGADSASDSCCSMRSISRPF
jgi:hypothetical protein